MTDFIRKLEESYKNMEDSEISIPAPPPVNMIKVPSPILMKQFCENVKNILIDLNQRIEDLENRPD